MSICSIAIRLFASNVSQPLLDHYNSTHMKMCYVFSGNQVQP